MGGLAGKRVLLTASVASASRLAPALERLGAQVEARPTIELREPTDPAPARRALGEISRYDWLVFTSANGVRAFASVRAASSTGETRPLTARVAAVGPGTAAALREAGIEPAIVAQRSDARGLLDELTPHVEAGAAALVVGPEAGSSELPRGLRAAGVEVDALAFYRNVPAPGVRDTVRALLDGAYDAVVFTSPSSFIRLLEALPEQRAAVHRALSATRRVALGSSTGAALERAGLRADATSAEPTAESLARAVVASFESRSNARGGADR